MRRPGASKPPARSPAPGVVELESVWHAAEAPGREIEVDLREVTCVDEAGRQLLERMHGAGARLIARGVLMNALVEAIARPVKHIAPILAVLFLLHGISLRAQDAPTPLRLTLHDAVSIALRQNPEVTIANLNLAESHEGRNMARAALLPNASLRASENVIRGNVAVQAQAATLAYIGVFWLLAGFSALMFLFLCSFLLKANKPGGGNVAMHCDLAV